VKLTLASYWRSSSAWRVRIGLHLKDLDFAYRAVNLLQGEQRSPEHRAVSPLGAVPVLTVEEAGRTLHLVQSMAILELLDERFPVPGPLLPDDPEGRARVRALAEHVNSSLQPYQNAAPLRWLEEHEQGLAARWVRHWLELGMAGLERAASDGAGRFCHGDTPTLADLYLVPQLYGCRRYGLDVAAYPTLTRIEAACRELEAFRRAEPDAQPDAPPPEKRS
jgi:maleylpyruvate isomerase